MQVTVEDLSSVKKTLHIEIPEETITREIDKAYQDLGKKSKLKGFRPGKAPRAVLVQYFKKDVHADVTSKLIQESFLEAIKETDLQILGKPKIDPPELKTKEPYKYSATVEISPDIGDIDIKSMTLKKTLYEISDKEVDTQLAMLQKNLAKHEPIEEDRPLADGDFAVIEYEGFKDGEPFPDLQKTENYMLKVGKATMTEAFDEKIIGMKPDETREVQVTFPEDYFNKSLANLDITFQVILREIRKEILPDLDDDLSKKMGKYETLDDLKTAIRDNLKQGYDGRVEQEMNEQIFQGLLNQTGFEVPDALVEFELEHIVSDAERYFSQHNVQMEDAGVTRESLSEQYRDVAVKQAKRHLILQKIIEQEDISITDEERDTGLQEMSATYQQPVEDIRKYYNENQDRFEGFRQALLEKKAIRLIVDSSNIEEVTPEIEPEAEKTPEEAE
jgi:trigger factor